MYVCLSSQRSVPDRLRDKDNVGLVSLEAASHWEETAECSAQICWKTWWPRSPRKQPSGYPHRISTLYLLIIRFPTFSN
jgi:hypothetical protein